MAHSLPSLPKNGIYIVQGEQNVVVTAIRNSLRSSYRSSQSSEENVLLSNFMQLKETLGNITDLKDIDPNVFLSPFLEVIRSEDTTGQVTGLALTSVRKFITYQLIDPDSASCPLAVENIADSITHARFVGTDAASDEVVLMRILHDLLAVLQSPVGKFLTNESVCEIVQSCFRICFEMRLSELLRSSADHTLVQMVHLLFSRLPEFKDEPRSAASVKKLKMRMDSGRRKKDMSLNRKVKGQKSGVRRSGSGAVLDTEVDVSISPGLDPDSAPFAEVPEQGLEATEAERSNAVTDNPGEGETLVTADGEKDLADKEDGNSQPPAGREGEEVSSERQGEVSLAPDSLDGDSSTLCPPDGDSSTLIPPGEGLKGLDTGLSGDHSGLDPEGGESMNTVEEDPDITDNQFAGVVNPKGVTFVPLTPKKDGTDHIRTPYGLPCVRELFRFLVSITNPLDKTNNEVMVQAGLTLLTVALETAADHLPQFESLLALTKNELCCNMFRLLNVDKISLIAASQRVCFLLFESTRSHLKYQLEMYIGKLMEIISPSERGEDGKKKKIALSPFQYEQKAAALESVVQLWKIPGLVAELFLNYDCDVYCTNLFEDVTNLLSEKSFPVSGLSNTHLLSLDALLTVVDSIEQHCHSRVLETRQDRIATQQSSDEQSGDSSVPPRTPSFKGPRIKPNRLSSASTSLPSSDEIKAVRKEKMIIRQGIEKFNKKASDGITFLKEHGVVSEDPNDVAHFLRAHASLNKAELGEFISRKKFEPILLAFIKSFDLEGKRIDVALRAFLESFRLPGESPVIEYLMERFAAFWHDGNGCPFHSADSAFTLIYAVIMLNVDQHNQNAKKQNVPMTPFQFKKNLKKCNGNEDFDQGMLDEIYEEIRNNEIVMPDEREGNVKENYLWKELLRKSGTESAEFVHAPTGSCDKDLFGLSWGPAVAALASVFDKSMDSSVTQRALSGFRKFAMISAHYSMSEVFDNLIITLCKFTTLLSSTGESNESGAGPVGMGGGTGAWMVFAMSDKAQLAAHMVFELARQHMDILREGWENILTCIHTLYEWRLVPEELAMVDDFLHPDRVISLRRKEDSKENQKPDSMLNALFGYFGSGSGGADSSGQKSLNEEEERLQISAKECVESFSLLDFLEDTKFLTEDSLQELVKALIRASSAGTLGANRAATTSGPESLHHHHMNGGAGREEEDGMVFNLELLIRVVLCNRDRVGSIWASVRDHFSALIIHSTECSFLVERAVTGLLRLVMRLLCREDIASLVLPSLHVFLLMKPSVARPLSRQLAYGLHQLLETNAANIHSQQEWYILLTLLEVVGAGGPMPDVTQILSGQAASATLEMVRAQAGSFDTGALSDSELTSIEPGSPMGSPDLRGYTSDGELYGQRSASLPDLSHRHTTSIAGTGDEDHPTPPSWNNTSCDTGISLHGDSLESSVVGTRGSSQPAANQFRISLNVDLVAHDPQAMLKAIDSMQLLIRDAAHVTPYNYETCVHTIRLFVEANVNEGEVNHVGTTPEHPKGKKSKHKKKKRDDTHHHHHHGNHMSKSQTAPSHLYSPDSNNGSPEDLDALRGAYVRTSLQLLELMQTLHSQAANIFSSWAAVDKEEGSSAPVDDCATNLWNKCWCPLLQGIARLCCDERKEVQRRALTCLEQAFIVSDLERLRGPEWEACFNKVIFPLLSALLEGRGHEGSAKVGSPSGKNGALKGMSHQPQDPAQLEESRSRASRLLAKVFLLRLDHLLCLPTFTALWLTILDFMDKYMNADKSEFLYESIPESLKNILLVMNKEKVFYNRSDSSDGGHQLQQVEEHNQLWQLTWDRISTFLPNLRRDLFHSEESRTSSSHPAPSSLPQRDGELPQISPPTRSNTASPTAGLTGTNQLPQGTPQLLPLAHPQGTPLHIAPSFPQGTPQLVASSHPQGVSLLSPAEHSLGGASISQLTLIGSPAVTAISLPPVPLLIGTPPRADILTGIVPASLPAGRVADLSGSSLMSGAPYAQLQSPAVRPASPLTVGELPVLDSSPSVTPLPVPGFGMPPAGTHGSSPLKPSYSNTGVSLLLDPGIMQGTKIPMFSAVGENISQDLVDGK